MSGFTEEQLENAGNAWRDRIVDVQESEDMICITYAIPYAEGNPPISATPGDLENPLPGLRIEPIPGVSIETGLNPTQTGSIWEPRNTLRPTIRPSIDPIGGLISNEIENRFGGGQMTVCHRKGRNDSSSNSNIPPQFPSSGGPRFDLSFFDLHDENEDLSYCGLGWKTLTFQAKAYLLEYRYYGGQYHYHGWIVDEDFSGVRYEVLNPTRIQTNQTTSQNGYFYHIYRGVWCEGVRVFVENSLRTQYVWGSQGFISTPFNFTTSLFSNWLTVEPGDFWSGAYACFGSAKCRIFAEGKIGYRIQVQCSSSDRPTNHRDPNNTIPRNDMVNCCERINNRLTEIERKIDRLLQFSGAASGGFEVPDTLFDQSPGDNLVGNIWDAITPDKKRHISNMPQFWMWWIEKQKEWWGSWPACQKDDKDNQMAIPNLAEAIKVIVGKEIILQREVAAVQLAAVKALLESCQDRSQNIYNASLIQCLLDFFELNPSEEIKQFPFQVSRFESENLSMEEIDTPKEIGQLCQGSAHDVKIAKIDFKKQRDSRGKPMETFSATALRSVKIWEAIRFLFGVQLNPDNLEADLGKFLAETRNFSKGKNGHGNDVVGTDDTNDFSQWCEKVEQQFANEMNPPDGAATQPWGNDLSDRPRIIVRGTPPVEGNDM